MDENKKQLLGQYFTKKEIVERVLKLLFEYKPYKKDIRILEPSFGSGNFISTLKGRGFKNIESCEIDPELTTEPIDFFKYPLKERFDLIIGNPPFTKYNIEGSYYYPKNYFLDGINPSAYINEKLLKRDKIQIENAFILKSIKQLKDKDSAIAFVLPISFFIKGKNIEVKNEIAKRFTTVIIYQNDVNFVDDPIPCCFAIFTNIDEFKDKIVLLYEDSKSVNEIVDKQQLLTEELIPRSFLYKKNVKQDGTPLSEFLLNKSVKYKLSFRENNIGGANILNRMKIPKGKKTSDYCLAVVRVGNSSVGRTGLVNPKTDILNGMFYVFEFKEKYNKNRKLKENLCKILTENQAHFKQMSYRVGSKSLKRADIFDFKIKA